MRIVVLSAKGQQDVSAVSIASALRTGHEVIEFDYAAAHTPFRGITPLRRVAGLYRRALEVAGVGETAIADAWLARFLRGRRFDLAIVPRANVVPPAVIDALRGTGALVVGWFMDAIVNFHAARFFEAGYHRVFFKDRLVVDHLRAITGSRTYDYLAQGFDPLLHVPMRPALPLVDVGSYGSGYPYRAALLAPLLAREGLTVEIHGGPGRLTSRAMRDVYRSYVRGLAKSAAVARFRIALNSSHFGELGGVNKRTFELAGMGAFQLTDGVAVANYLVPGEEVAVFRGAEDLVEKVDYFLARPELRGSIAAAGAARAWREHTWAHRCNELFTRVPELSGVAPLPIAHRPALAAGVP